MWKRKRKYCQIYKSIKTGIDKTFKADEERTLRKMNEIMCIVKDR